MFASIVALAVAVAVQDPAPYPRIQLEDHLPAPNARTVSLEAGYRAVDTNAEYSGDLGLPVVEMSVVDPNRLMSASVVFNRVQVTDGAGRRGVWFARLRAARGMASTELFADARTCPGVIASLEALSRLPDLTPGVPYLETESSAASQSALEVKGIILDDVSYSVRLRARFDGSVYADKITVAGGSYAPFAPIIVESLDRLKVCWTGTAPPR
ncbi:hypothetical protein [Brevundimonas sp.]|uniref:hypothetical protein n=1 Tax=Brevundimonas sp. TaxID=1871086 RepID=UPI003F71C6FB